MNQQAALNHPSQLLKLCRPQQWIKNGFVFAGLVFGHRWHEPALVLKVLIAAIAFSFASSTIYILNDVVDRDKDRLHPKKRYRPLAAGTVTIPAATAQAIMLALAASVLSLWVSWVAFVMIFCYAMLNVAYSIQLKHIVILDVFCIAAGFMIRILVGTVGVGIPPSKWLMLCGLMITLFLGFAKRRAEIAALDAGGVDHRSVLAHYGSSLLDQVSAICATGVIVTYCLYTTSPDTILVHHTSNLIFTAPFVIYALFRYIYLVQHQSSGGDPSRDLIRDKHIVASIVGWLITTVAILLAAQPAV